MLGNTVPLELVGSVLFTGVERLPGATALILWEGL